MLVAELEVVGDSVGFGAVETTDSVNGRSLLVGEEGWRIASGHTGLVFVDAESSQEDTSGRWLELTPDDTGEWAESLAEDLGDFAPLFLNGGLVLNTLSALASPGEATLIGREVVAGTATSHYLVEAGSRGLSTPVEAWVSDDGFLAQIRYLANTSVGEAVEVTALITAGSEGDLGSFPEREDAVTLDGLAEEAQLEEKRAAEEAARVAEARAEAEEAASNPIDGEDVVAEDVGIALNRRMALGEDMDGVFVLPEVNQLCVAISDMQAEGFQHNIWCQGLLSEELQAQLCPAVQALGSVFAASSSRVEIADAAHRVVASLDGESEVGLATTWQSFPPATSLELQDSETVDLPIREAAQNVSEIWANQPDMNGPFAMLIFVDNQHRMLDITCDVDLDYDSSIIEEQSPPGVAATSTQGDPDEEVDPLAAALPISRGDQGRNVEEVQLLLVIAGESLYPDGADGIYGPGTESTVRGFQTRSALSASGVIDSATLSLLRAIEQASGAAPRTAADPRCPTTTEVRAAVLQVSNGESDFDIVDQGCSGPWGAAALVYPDFADGESLLLEFDGSTWHYIGSGFGDPAELCDRHDVPLAHRPRLEC